MRHRVFQEQAALLFLIKMGLEGGYHRVDRPGQPGQAPLLGIVDPGRPSPVHDAVHFFLIPVDRPVQTLEKTQHRKHGEHAGNRPGQAGSERMKAV
ncbi:hypothetical protein D1872_231830 [compost metagenome]